MLQRTLSHSFAMSSGCKGAPPQSTTPPMASAHTQVHHSTAKDVLSRQCRASSAFTMRLNGRYSRRRLIVRADADYGASWKDSQEAFLVLVRAISCVCLCLTLAKNLGVRPSKFCLQGLAHCFEKNENGKLADCFVIEPISANSLEVWDDSCAKSCTVRVALQQYGKCVPIYELNQSAR